MLKAGTKKSQIVKYIQRNPGSTRNQINAYVLGTTKSGYHSSTYTDLLRKNIIVSDKGYRLTTLGKSIAANLPENDDFQNLIIENKNLLFLQNLNKEEISFLKKLDTYSIKGFTIGDEQTFSDLESKMFFSFLEHKIIYFDKINKLQLNFFHLKENHFSF